MRRDVQQIENRRQSRTITPSHECPDREAIEGDIDYLVAQIKAARATIERLTEGDADLQASASLWSRLYDAAAGRAQAAEERVQQLLEERVPPPASVTTARACVTRLREELSATVECCSRCLEALDALAAGRD